MKIKKTSLDMRGLAQRVSPSSSSFLTIIYEDCRIWHLLVYRGCRGFIGPVPPPLWMSFYLIITSECTTEKEDRQIFTFPQIIRI